MKTNIQDKIAVDACMWSYETQNKAVAYMKKSYGAYDVKFHSIIEVDMQFLTFSVGDDKWLVIRGTKGKQDVLTDLDLTSHDLLITKIRLRKQLGKKAYALRELELDRVKAVKKKMGLRHIHFGFFKSAESISRYLIKKDIHITHLAGHSLGGGVAHILAMFLTGLQQVITFGAPRSGGISFARKYNKRYKKITRRFFNHRDIVPKVPLRIMFYMHVANGLYFNSEGKLYDRMEQLRDLFDYFKDNKINLDIKKEIKKAKKARKKPEFLTDHFLNTDNPTGYYSNVCKNMA